MPPPGAIRREGQTAKDIFWLTIKKSQTFAILAANLSRHLLLICTFFYFCAPCTPPKIFRGGALRCFCPGRRVSLFFWTRCIMDAEIYLSSGQSVRHRPTVKQVRVQPLPSALNVTLPAFAAQRRRLQSIDISCPPAGCSAANPTHVAAVVNRWDRQMDGRTDARTFHRPCSAYYTGKGTSVTSCNCLSHRGTLYEIWVLM